MLVLKLVSLWRKHASMSYAQRFPQHSGMSRTVEALLDSFAYRCHSPLFCSETCEAGMVPFHDVGQEQEHDQAQVLRSPGPLVGGMWSPSTLKDGCYSDPGACMHDGYMHAHKDAEMLSMDDGDTDGVSRLLLSARQDMQVKQSRASLPHYDANNDRKLAPAAMRQCSPRRLSLPRLDSPLPRRLNASQNCAAGLSRSQQVPVYSMRSGSTELSPCSSPGSMSESSHEHAGATHGIRQSCSIPPSAAAPTIDDSAHLRSMSMHASRVTGSSSDAGMIHSQDADQDMHDRPNSAHLEQGFTVHHGSCQLVQTDSHIARFSGAHRRRLRRQQEHERMQVLDPHGWLKLQQTMQAMMPYCWDKCVQLLTYMYVCGRDMLFHGANQKFTNHNVIMHAVMPACS